MINDYKSHYSVLKTECLGHMRSIENKKSLFADLTFGGGGHTLAILEKFPDSRIYSTDQDIDAFNNGQKLIEKAGAEDRIELLNINFETFPAFCAENSLKDFNGFLLDLGVSSHHFDEFSRGFSFREDAPLDMRMNTSENTETASDLLNNLSEVEIADLIYKFGEERYSRRIAKKIIESRNNGEKVQTTKQLENICFHSYPKHERHKKTHPATKTFQALRIAVNKELEVLENTIEKLYELLAPGGRMAIITFHSLEDRIVKHKYREIFENNKKTAKILTKKPIYPSEKEIEENNRSRSAKLRVIEKLT